MENQKFTIKDKNGKVYAQDIESAYEAGYIIGETQCMLMAEGASKTEVDALEIKAFDQNGEAFD